MTQPNPKPVEKPKRSNQNKAMGEFIAEAGVLLTTALADEEILEKLSKRSYNATKIAQGVGLQNAAQAAYNSRQGALGGREEAVQDQKTMFDEERAEFEAFRTLARPVFPSKGDRTAMNLNSTVPQAMREFITFTRAAYTNAKADAYQELLAPLGYDVAQLDKELDELKTFEATLSGTQGSTGGAISSTDDRNTSFRALKAWMDAFEGVCKVTLGPDLHKMPFDELPNVSVPKAE